MRKEGNIDNIMQGKHAISNLPLTYKAYTTCQFIIYQLEILTIRPIKL